MTAIIGQTRSPKHRIAYIPERLSGELKPFLKEGLIRAAILDSGIDPERVRSVLNEQSMRSGLGKDEEVGAGGESPRDSDERSLERILSDRLSGDVVLFFCGHGTSESPGWLVIEAKVNPSGEIPPEGQTLAVRDDENFLVWLEGERPDRAGTPRSFSEDEAERFYDCLGAWKGPLATREAQQEALDFWRSGGEEGIRWLVRRLREEHHVDALHGVASLLADLGEGILGPIFEELSAGAPGDQALALLRALGWLSESEGAPRLEGVQAELVLADLLQEDDPDLREAAARALRLLSREKAIRWLSRRLRDETDPEVRTTIEEELKRDRAEKV